MKRLALIILASICVMVPVLGHQPDAEYPTETPKVRFAPVHIYADSGEKPLAAFQFELKAVLGQVEIVGVEGGEHAAFAEPGYYDPAALANDRIIIAAFNTGGDVPTGRTRIATIHLQITGEVEPKYELELVVAADADGEEIPAEITIGTGEQK